MRDGRIRVERGVSRCYLRWGEGEGEGEGNACTGRGTRGNNWLGKILTPLYFCLIHYDRCCHTIDRRYQFPGYSHISILQRNNTRLT